ncbi:TPR repeat protein [Methylohalomonas lacus]|uniref:TPR repeat protein n=1 Tax=Methylohalomonas lacus TaxID=398773 RepID=A0AAE3HN40_9GAMM|nr:tetratricopeptide repeat protein [Methylohalomonas lacus]MCS3903538.1 TPR repeat protein [Methylohalomonas lacus]
MSFLLAGCGASDDPQAAFEAGDYERAHELWLPRAEAGDAEAQNALGTMHYLGLGSGRDYRKAQRWFEQAARQGHPGAQRNLGMLYSDGRGVERDYIEAYSWFYAADKQGNASADAYIKSLASKLTPNQQMKARRMADRYILNPTADYLPELKPPELESGTKDMRATDNNANQDPG